MYLQISSHLVRLIQEVYIHMWARPLSLASQGSMSHLEGKYGKRYAIPRIKMEAVSIGFCFS
jgi:hypothetical protein